MRFTYDGRQMQTSVKTDAGKQPVWNETFFLEGIASDIEKGGKLRLEAFDEDTVSNDWLGATLTIPYTELVHTTDPIDHDLEILDKGANKIGNINIQTQYIWAEPPPESPE